MLPKIKRNNFFRYEAMHVTKNKTTVLLQKGLLLLLMMLVLPLLLMVRLLRPFVLVRFGELKSRRIGYLARDTEMYLCEQDLKMDGKRTFDIFYFFLPVSNQQLQKMWQRVLRVWNFWLVYPVAKLNRCLPGGVKHIIPGELEEGIKNRDIHGLLASGRIHISFTPEEERQGYNALLELGLPKGAPFVCFNVRDSTYLDKLYPSYNWRYLDCRDSNIHNYIPAIEELVRRGYFAIRMGAIVKEPLESSNSKIIDYATKHRTDFLDIYMCAKCHFFIGSAAGIDEVPTIFRRPLMIVNCIPIEYVNTWFPNYLFITKKLWLCREGRFLTFREMLSSGIGRFFGEEYKQAGIDVIDNKSEEIAALAIEMDERLKGTWKTTPEDEQLQARFRSIFQSSKFHGKITARMGAGFLRQNQKLLD